MTMIGYFFWGFVLVLVAAALLIRMFKKDSPSNQIRQPGEGRGGGAQS